MTGDSMKSNLAVESRYRSEGRPGYLRRRASRPMHIDPEDTDLTLAIQESLRYAKLHEQKLAKENASSEANETKHDDSDCSKTINDMPTDGAQEKNLKELMVLHIDYVHQLNRTIADRDEEIRDLKAAYDALQCRLERMERRMAMLKHKGEAHTVHDPNFAVSSMHGPPGEKSLKRVRRQLKPSKNHFKKCKSSQKGILRLRERDSQKQSYKEESSEDNSTDGNKDDDDDDDDDNEEKDDQSSSDETAESSRDDAETTDVESQTESETEMEIINNDDIVTTRKPYYVDIPACYQRCELQEKPVPPVGATPPPVVAEGMDPVEVPGWRRHVVTNLYQMEGTENIEDEEYRRRHAKPEAEERRRKRWDLQQMREQELLERQRKRQQAELPVHMQPTPYVNSFYPNPEEITHIEVTRDIPVMMFGRPLPKITQQDFELPWKVPARHSARLGGQRRK